MTSETCLPCFKYHSVLCLGVSPGKTSIRMPHPALLSHPSQVRELSNTHSDLGLKNTKQLLQNRQKHSKAFLHRRPGLQPLYELLLLVLLAVLLLLLELVPSPGLSSSSCSSHSSSTSRLSQMSPTCRRMWAMVLCMRVILRRRAAAMVRCRLR